MLVKFSKGNHHDVILDEEIPVQALAAKVKCFSEARIVKIWFWIVKTFLFEVFQPRHNYLSFGSKLLLRASVFSLLQLHWIFVAFLVFFRFFHLVGGEVLETSHAAGHLGAKPHSKWFPPDEPGNVSHEIKDLNFKYISKWKRCCKKTKTFQTVMP